MKVPPLEYPTQIVRKELDRIRHPLRIAVQRSKNPFNIGAIIRTAHSFLVREIILIGDTPYYQRASMGMEKYENIVEISSDEQFIGIASEKRWNLLVFEKDQANVSLWQADFPNECVLVFGNEDTGVGARIVAAAYSVVAIPMFGVNHSYPVSVAAGIAMAEWARRYYQGGRITVPV
ncbi:MAG: TrmH family RNA methyltransferase [Deltaproteobacteria bacterium]|nr:TrmH family RNA methyltransferase [Deltaproteobacteria bacterium]